MKIFLISYDLSKPERDYESLITIINTFDKPIRILKSVWLIESNDTTTMIYDALRNHIDRDDTLFVCPLDFSGSVCSNLKDAKIKDWFNEHLYDVKADYRKH